MQNFRKCLTIDMLFEGGRMTVGAISVAYVLSIGLHQDAIAYLKIVQAIVLLFGEIPTGVFADTFGHKKSLIAACCSAIIGLLIYNLSSNFLYFALGEVFLALALCFWSGAYEAFSIDACALDKGIARGKMDRFFHLNHSLTSLSVLVLGGVGGIIGGYSYRFAYVAGIVILILAAWTITTITEISEGTHRNEGPKRIVSWFRAMTNHAKEAGIQLISLPQIVPFIIANLGLQFLIQPILHYWQPLFAQLDGLGSPPRLGAIFSGYCGTTIIFSYFFGKLSKFIWARSKICTVFLFSGFAVFYYLFAHTKTAIVAIPCFLFLHGFLAIARTSLSVRLNELLPSKHRASMLSTIGLISRLGMMASLLLIGHILGQSTEGEKISSVFESFSFGSVIAVSLLCLVILIQTISRRKNS